jgi:hypothetical protein
MRRTVVAAVCLMLSLPALCSAEDLAKLLSGKTYPLAVTLRDLGGEWRRVTIGASTSANGNVTVSVTGSGSVSNNQNNFGTFGASSVYVTRGQTVSAGGQIYLVAYHLPNTGLDLNGLLQAVAIGKPPQPAVLTPETVLPLALLDLRTVGSLNDVRVFDLKAEIAESEATARRVGLLFKALAAQQKQQPKK